MPELPDITVYIEALTTRVLDKPLESVRLASPFLLRTITPPLSETFGRKVLELRRVGKRIAFGLEDDLWLVLHLMIAGRLHWKNKRVAVSRKAALAAFDFPDGTLTLTEAGSRHRASLHLLQGEHALQAMDPGGLEVLSATRDEFAARLTSSNHTLKRSLTDPRLFSGIGNAYSDEILFHALLSPILQTQKMSPEQITTLYEATRRTLTEWIDRLRQEAGESFPEHVTAFRKDMAVHGRYGQPCLRCGAKVQRIRYADNETNYCANCQTQGKLLADRSLSRLLRSDWPRTLEELESLHSRNSE
jgi:formamidopyrimidine-DNA glycosylase